MNFSISNITPSILEPLRYYFSKYATGANLVWSSDPNSRTIDIFEDFNDVRVALGQKPRIVVSRGGFQVNKTGLNDNLAEAPSIGDARGLKRNVNMVFYEGATSIIIEARNKGVCELITDMVTHFIVWTRPVIIDAGGWKEFGLPLSVSQCSLAENEDPEVPKFQCAIQVPWSKEEQWLLKTDAPELKRILLDVYAQ